MVDTSRRHAPLAPGFRLARILVANRRVLRATTRVELEKRYSGSLLGRAWIVVYPVLFLCIYLFLYIVVFKVRYKDLSTLGYVLYIFTGLVPYIGLMEAVTAGAVSVKMNLHLVRNIILPIELIPVRAVCIAVVSELIGLVMVIGLTIANGSVTPRLALLPVALAIEVVYLLGVVLCLAPLGVLFPDIATVTNLAVLFVLFVSPIAFKPTALPSALHFIVWINPVYYLLLPFRLCCLPVSNLDWGSLPLGAAMALITYFVGSYFFMRSKDFLVDYD